MNNQQPTTIRLTTTHNKLLLIVCALLVGGGLAILIGTISDTAPYPSVSGVSTNCLLRDITLNRCVPIVTGSVDFR